MFNPLQSFTSALRLAMPLRASSSRRTLVPAFRPMIASSSSRSIVNITLSNIKKAPGSSQHTRRRGRGVGSGKGGHTSGRGHKGARARGTGVPYRGFEGGQTPLHRRLPKRGFVNMLRKEYAPLNIASLQQWIQAKRIDPTQPITIHQVVQSNLVHSISKISGVKLLGEADPTIPLPPLDCQLSKYSKKAARQIIAAGGKVSAVYHNNLGLRAEAYPQKFPGIKQAKPTRRADIEYYTDPKNHGYLSSPEVKEAFFRERGWRTPEEKKADKEAYAMVKY